MPAVTSASFDPSSFSFKTFVPIPFYLVHLLPRSHIPDFKNLTSLSSAGLSSPFITSKFLSGFMEPVLSFDLLNSTHFLHLASIVTSCEIPLEDAHPWAIEVQEIPISGTCFERSSLYSPLHWSLCSLRPSINIMFIIVSPASYTMLHLLDSQPKIYPLNEFQT